MNRIIIILTVFLLPLCSCGNKEAENLRNSVQKEYSAGKAIKKLSSGGIAQYIQMEKNINKRYVQDLEQAVNSGFERQLENFEDHELGVWSSYGNMFSWLFKSKRSWEEELKLKSSRYFNSLDLEQEQNVLYMQYVKQIKELRQQFLTQQDLPQYTQYDLPKEKISLQAFSNHTMNNVGIEAIGLLLGSELFGWFLGIFISWLLITLFGAPFGPPGWLISVLVFIIGLVVSMFMTWHNDSKFMDQIREQHVEAATMDSTQLLEELDTNTIRFYEKL